MTSRQVELDVELDRLTKLLKCRQAERDELRRQELEEDAPPPAAEPATSLTPPEVKRYSRQLIMPEIGVSGQLRLKNASVLVVGVGGLGCAAALHLAGAGCGHIGLLDADTVELNNLHRQLLHTERMIGCSKVISGRHSLQRLNSCVRVSAHIVQLTSRNALDIVRRYDICIDASDNAPTRYLVNDACVLLGKPLVSGSALRLEGHLTVLNAAGSPCYRCLYPVPPPPEQMQNCGDTGVLGAVVGVIGTLQALEAIKLCLGRPVHDTLAGRLLLFDAANAEFRTIALRRRQPSCAVCGERPTIKELVDYETFCGTRATDKTGDLQCLDSGDRCAVMDFARLQRLVRPEGSKPRWLLVDVRTETEFEIGSIEGAMCVPITAILEGSVEAEMEERLLGDTAVAVYVVCRRGNDSQRAVVRLRQMAAERAKRRAEQEGGEEVAAQAKQVIVDLVGGLTAWQRQVDAEFPIY